MESFNRSGYLQSIRSFYDKWEERCPFFDAEWHQTGSREGLGEPHILDLFVEVEEPLVKENAREHAGPLNVSTDVLFPGTSGLSLGPSGIPDDVSYRAYPGPRKTDRNEVLAALKRYSNAHVLLKGRPGSGKSVALARFLLEEARDAAEDPSRQLPVLVDLRHYETSVKDLIAEFLMMHAAGEVSSDDIDRMLAAGELLLLLDGLDELPLPRDKSGSDPLVEVTALEKDHPSVPMVFTSGTTYPVLDWELDNVLVMAPLGRDQVRHLVRKQVTQGADRTLASIGYGSHEPSTTPLFLSILCAVFQSDKRLPDSLSLTYRRYIQIAFERIRNRLSHELSGVALQFLSYLAFTMIGSDSPTGHRFALRRTEVEEVFGHWLEENAFRDLHERVGSFVDELLEHHFIEQGQGTTIGFPHRSLRDYYAAEHLLNLFPGMKRDTIQQQYINCLKWAEPLDMMAGLLESGAKAVETVNLALEVDAYFGARLAGSVPGRYRQRTVSTVNDLDTHALHRVLLLEVTHSNASVPFLAEFLRSKDAELRLWTTAALGELVGDEAVQLVGKVLNDLDPNVQRCAAFALSNLGGDNALQFLRRSLAASDEDLRRSAMEALATMSPAEVLPTLVQALRDPEEELRRLAAEGLGNVGGQEAVQALGRALKDPDPEVRYVAAQALGHIGATEAVPALLEALDEPDRDLNCVAAEALGSISSGEAVSGLCRVLDDPYEDLRWRATDALGAIGSREAVAPLSRALEDPDTYLRWKAAEALGNIGSEESVSLLCQALEDPDEHLRWRAAEAWDKIGSLDTIQPLTAALGDPDQDVRLQAAEALGNNGSPEAVQRFIQALKEGDEDVRWDMMNALRAIGTERSVPILTQALNDRDKELQWAAVLALGNVPPKHAVPLLLHALDDPDEDLRQTVALQMGNFGCEEAAPVLLPMLEDPDEAIAWSAATALAYIGSVEAIPLLSRALEYGDKFEKRQAIDCLESIASKEVVKPLSRALRDQDEEVRLRAALALASVGSKEAVPTLIELVLNLDGFVRRQVTEAEHSVTDDQETRPLDELMAEKASSVREAVATALLQVASADVLATLRETVNHDFDPFLHQCMLSMQLRLGIRNGHFQWK